MRALTHIAMERERERAREREMMRAAVNISVGGTTSPVSHFFPAPIPFTFTLGLVIHIVCTYIWIYLVGVLTKYETETKREQGMKHDPKIKARIIHTLFWSRNP